MMHFETKLFLTMKIDLFGDKQSKDMNNTLKFKIKVKKN